ncbi:hypothetical protein ZEAMMB73_Zm00001d005277 [Zea mays]|uniref:Uncharacterized protein n=1 Tax=Zea mays TaxID=4577 RepID=A0A1D6ELH7_MAIZE|nr:hypothetical protein ZEAMMB73_Zm00001d005277 [Zea mays]
MERQNQVSNLNKGRRVLVVIELSGDLYEDAWNRSYLASKWSLCSGSKLIGTSRSDKIVKFGTTRALTLNSLSHAAYWYFFKYHRSSQEEVPEIRIQDVLYGSIKRHGKFEVLAWRSQIPPYYSYVHACEI